MSDNLTLVLIYLMLLLVLVLGVVMMRSLRRRVQVREISRPKAVGVFIMVTLLPVLGFVGVFLFLVGVEAALQIPLITEGFGRTFLLSVALGTTLVSILMLVFIVILLLRSKRT